MHNNFSEFFKLYYQDIYHFSFSFVKNKEDAEDITQDVFIKFYNNPPIEDSKVKSWLFVVAANISKDYLKKRKKDKDKIKCIQEGKMNFRDYDDNIIVYIDELPNKYQEVIRLYYYGHLSVADISNVLNISAENVRKRLERARNELKKMLEVR